MTNQPENPPALQWTTKLPKEAGFYWYRADKCRDVILEIAEEEFGGNIDLFVKLGNGPDDINFIENFPGLWAGPLRPPRKDKRNDAR